MLSVAVPKAKGITSLLGAALSRVFRIPRSVFPTEISQPKLEFLLLL